MQRIPALSGVIFVVLFVLAVVAYGGGAGSDPAGISAYYARPASWRHQELGFALMLAACLFLIVYLAVLARLLPATGLARTIATISAAVHVGLLIAANALWASSAFFADIEGVNIRSTRRQPPDGEGALRRAGPGGCRCDPGGAGLPGTPGRIVRTGLYDRLGLAAAAGLAGTFWFFPLARSCLASGRKRTASR